GYRRWIDVDMNDLAVGAEEVRRIADHPIVETRTDGDEHVAVLHRHVRFVGAMHAGKAGELRIAPRKAAEPHEGGGAGKTEEPHEPGELRGGGGEDDAA